MDQGRGGIGAKSKRQNAQAQAKKHAQAKQKNEPPLPIQPSNESIFREIFGPHTIIRDWSVVLGIIGEVLDQLEDYCWAIVFARLMQATYNQGLPTPQQHEFSFLELVDHIKPRENESSALANLKIAIDHIASHGIMKKPIKIGDESIHCILLIGYGMTTQGELYFIGQNSWGTDWGCRGYVRIIINELCDIICLKE
ncbi:hypothetical protein ARALYDRAFT_920512 [Arabidopsis lyrata subsp. lyrata]|uniref:Peptidase C1A papain C-terminal domain-containing protein n=1 Tax=Arabidopsis lyrata subsp. lyrata TaxID=81972 RepID=D7MX87_ARALL|nr:hypothetical protein ARALYDRAFT_920512 [Arabidopsis lyrata subsp. lyrata]